MTKKEHVKERETCRRINVKATEVVANWQQTLKEWQQRGKTEKQQRFFEEKIDVRKNCEN